MANPNRTKKPQVKRPLTRTHVALMRAERDGHGPTYLEAFRTHLQNFSKGQEVLFCHPKSGEVLRGKVFWLGPSKYTNLVRLGVTVKDETHWVDAVDAAPAEDHPLVTDILN